MQLRERPPRHHNAVRMCWKQRWTNGTATSRCMIGACCGCMVFLVLLVVGLAVAALQFSTQCSALGDHAEDSVFEDASTAVAYASMEDGVQEASPAALTRGSSYGGVGDHIFVESAEKRGVVRLVLAGAESGQASGTTQLGVVRGAFRSRFAAGDFPDLRRRQDNSVGVVAEQTTPTKIMGFDVSCHYTDVEVQVAPHAAAASTARMLGTPSPGDTPLSRQRALQAVLQTDQSRARAAATSAAEASSPEQVPGLRLSASMSGTFGGIDLSLPQGADDSEIELIRGELVTGGGAIDLTNVRLGALGLRAETGLGELTLQGVSARCNPLLLGQSDYNVDLSTDLGGISLLESNFTDCDVLLRGSQSLVRVERTVVRNTQGAGTLRLVGEQGLIELTDTDAQVYDIRGSAGSVRAYRPLVREAMRAATVSGGVRIDEIQLDPRAVLQVETD